MMNNIPEESFKTMLANFLTSDLQGLLEAVGQNIVGRRVELRERALELLRCQPTGFNYIAYLLKILEIYNYKKSGRSNNDVTHNFIQPQHGQVMFMGQMQTPQQMINPQLQYFPQQLMHIGNTGHMTHAGLPQFLINMQNFEHENHNTTLGNTIANNNIQYASSSYQPAESYGTLPSNLPLNQQNTARFVVNELTNGNNNVPSPQTVANYKFKQLPFFELVDEIIDPIILNGPEICTLETFTKGTRECLFSHIMTVEQASLIAMNRDISFGKKEYLYQYQIRICQLESECSDEVTDFFPLGLHIRIGNKICPLPSNISSKLGSDSRRIAGPINCSHYLKLCPLVVNTITVNWIPDGKTYALAVFIVRQLSSDDLINKLKEKEVKSSEETKMNIINKFTVIDSDFYALSQRFSLVCPLSKKRMELPAKSIHCDHIQCFDAVAFILMNEKKPSWTCPTCNKSCLYNDIRIENYFLEIVTNPMLENNIKEIEILADGSWIVFKEKKDTKNTNSTLDTKENPIDSINLDDSGNETSTAPKKELESETSERQEHEKLKPRLIDLTLDEDEEPSEHENKLENEAQAADDIQPDNDAIQLNAIDKQPLLNNTLPDNDAIQLNVTDKQPLLNNTMPDTDTIQPVSEL